MEDFSESYTSIPLLLELLAEMRLGWAGALAIPIKSGPPAGSEELRQEARYIISRSSAWGEISHNIGHRVQIRTYDDGWLTYAIKKRPSCLKQYSKSGSSPSVFAGIIYMEMISD